jgi:hypothetical protein
VNALDRQAAETVPELANAIGTFGEGEQLVLPLAEVDDFHAWFVSLVNQHEERKA